MTTTDTIKTLLLQAARGQNPDNLPVKELMSQMKLALATRSLERARAKAIGYQAKYRQKKLEEEEVANTMELTALQAQVAGKGLAHGNGCVVADRAGGRKQTVKDTQK